MTATTTRDLGPRRVWTLKSFDEAARVEYRQTNGDHTAAATRGWCAVAATAVATAGGLEERRRPLEKATTTKNEDEDLATGGEVHFSCCGDTTAHSTHYHARLTTECFVCTCSLPTLSERRIRATTPAFFLRTRKNSHGTRSQCTADEHNSIYLLFVCFTYEGSAQLLSRSVTGARRSVTGDLRCDAH